MMVLLVDQKRTYFESPDKDLSALTQKYLARIKEKKIDREMIVHPAPNKKCPCYYVYAPALIKYFNDTEAIKIAIDRALDFASSMGYTRVCCALTAPDGAVSVSSIVESAVIGRYSFKKYKKSNDTKREEQELHLVVKKTDLANARNAADTTVYICTVINECRDVINEPPDAVFPDSLAKVAQTIARKNNLSCTVFKDNQLKQMKYNGILTVGRGSTRKPRMVVMRYTPAKTRKSAGKSIHLCLIGKGMTYDTGGHCLKPCSNMWEMKSDMSGAAAVMFTMALVARIKPPFSVSAVIPMAENAIGSRAALPGEIIRYANGKSAHVLNTDAEGRLILADALYHAGKLKASHIIDAATLTGSVVRALGTSITGVFSNDEKFAELIIDAGKQGGEDIWLMPLYDEYRQMIKSKVADIDNISDSPNAGSITAALFLNEFVPADATWAHLDIAGTAFTTKRWKYYKEGATGCPIKTFVALLKKLQ